MNLYVAGTACSCCHHAVRFARYVQDCALVEATNMRIMLMLITDGDDARHGDDGGDDGDENDDDDDGSDDDDNGSDDDNSDDDSGDEHGCMIGCFRLALARVGR